MKNVGKGETSTVEQSKVDEPVEITSRNDLNKLDNMSKDSKLKIIPVDAPLYKNIKGYWTPMTDENDKTKEIKLQKGDIVTYKGEYETFENAATGEKIAYLKVVTEDSKEGYVKLSTVELVLDDNAAVGKVSNQNIRMNVTSRANASSKTIGQDTEKYTVAIAAGRNNDDEKGITNKEKNLVEEELTIKVAEKVQEMLGEYTNIQVVQTGSTSNNPGGVKNKDRVQKTKDANPNLCIQIYFGDGDSSGVETIYRQGDSISLQLAEILSNNISKSMGLDNLGANADTDRCTDSNGNSAALTIIDNAAVTGFPSVVTMGGNLNKDTDANIIEKDGIEKYAQAIVKSIDEYFKESHVGRTATQEEETTYKDSTESKIINMKYTSPEKLQSYIDNSDYENVLKYYTIDEDRNLVVVTWNRNEDGNIELKTSNSMNLKNSLKKYVMPYEYLLYFYIDTNYEDFVNDLQEEVMKSEIVIAVQDNVTTTNTIETTKQRKDASVDKFDQDWHDTNTKNTTIESVSTSVNITYANTWCVKTYQENSYSEAVLEIGDEEEKIINVPGKVTESTSNSATSEEVVESGTNGYDEIEIDEEGTAKVVKKQYSYKIYEKVLTNTHTIFNSYEKGEYKTEGRENVFVELYNEHKMNAKVRTADYLFKIIENNEKTVGLLDLTKYLIYKATNEPWGVLEFDFDVEYSLNMLSSINGYYGGSIQEKVWFALLGAGFSKEATAGVLGNIQAESGFNQSAIEAGNGIGFGLCQWSFGRRSQIEAFAKSRGKEPSDINIQIEFLLGELTPGGGADGYAHYQLLNYNGYSANNWKNAKSPEEAAEAFCWSFERPGIPRMSVRKEAARKYYDEFKDKEKPTGDERIGEIKLSGENATKMMNMLNEAVRIADDDRYTYSKSNRYGEFQYDCSSLVARLYKQFFSINVPGTTSSYGKDYYIGSPKNVDLQPGDVMWKSGHVELYIGNGMTVGAHTDQRPVPDQISVVTLGSYTKVYRFITD